MNERHSPILSDSWAVNTVSRPLDRFQNEKTDWGVFGWPRFWGNGLGQINLSIWMLFGYHHRHLDWGHGQISNVLGPEICMPVLLLLFGAHQALLYGPWGAQSKDGRLLLELGPTAPLTISINLLNIGSISYYLWHIPISFLIISYCDHWLIFC